MHCEGDDQFDWRIQGQPCRREGGPGMMDHGKNSVHAFTQALPVRVGADRMGVPAVRRAAAEAAC